MRIRSARPRLGAAALTAFAAVTAMAAAGPVALAGAAHAGTSTPSTATPGTVFASDPDNNRIQAMTPDGTAFTAVSGLPYTPYGVAADAAGNLFIGDGYSGVIEVAPDGTQTTVPFSGLSFAFRVGVDAAGDVFVVDINNYRVLELPADGSGQRTVPTPGINYPFGLAVDQAGNAYVSDDGGSGVVEVAPDDTVSSVGSGFSSPQGVAVDTNGNVYVADSGNNRVVKVAPDNTQTIVTSDVNYPESVAVDRADSVYVSNDYYYYSNNYSVTQIDPDGTESHPNLQVGYTYGLAVSPNPRLAQNLTFTSQPSATPAVGDRYDVTAAAGQSGRPVVFSADGASANVCTVVSHGDTTATVTLTGTGTCTVNASQAGNRGYLPGSAQQSFGVKANQPITFTSPAHRHHTGDTYQVTATGGQSGNPVTFSVAASTSGACTVSTTGSVHFKHAKRCTVVASQDGGNAFYPARAFKSLVVRRGVQEVELTKVSGHHVAAHSSYRFKAKGGHSGNPVRIHVTGACIVTPGGKVTFKHDGVCHVSAVQAGDADWLAGRAGYRVVVAG